MNSFCDSCISDVADRTSASARQAFIHYTMLRDASLIVSNVQKYNTLVWHSQRCDQLHLIYRNRRSYSNLYNQHPVLPTLEEKERVISREWAVSDASQEDLRDISVVCHQLSVAAHSK